MLKPYRRRGIPTSTRINIAILLSITALIVILNHLIQKMFRFRRDLIVKERQIQTHKTGLGNLPSTALITMSDPLFQDCVLQLLKSARQIGWKEPIYLLAIDYDLFDDEVQDQLDTLGVFVIKTRQLFDWWITEKFNSQKSYRRLEAKKFRKMEVFLNPIFRTYERLIYLDADGFLTSLEPMVRMAFPQNVTILMRQNDRSFNKLSFHENELAKEFLTVNQTKLLNSRFPNRAKSGASSYFIVDVSKLPSLVEVFTKSIEILCNFRPAFRLNDQTLLNLLFYGELAMFPYCSWDEIVIMEEPRYLLQYCLNNMQLQRWLLGQISFMYRHMAVEEKTKCVRKREDQKSALNGTQIGDLIQPPEALQLGSRTYSTCHEAVAAWRDSILP